jgi:hypothetical protein
MTDDTTTTIPTETLTPAEQDALVAVRARFQQNLDQFSDQELARLQFLQWLVQSDRINL